MWTWMQNGIGIIDVLLYTTRTFRPTAERLFWPKIAEKSTPVVKTRGSRVSFIDASHHRICMNDYPLFRNRYRTKSRRRPNWDYSNGCYFVTICTKWKFPWFGDICHGIVGLSDIGSIVADEWTKTAIIRPYVTLDAWIVMPDHMHGILTVDKHARFCDDELHGDGPDGDGLRDVGPDGDGLRDNSVETSRRDVSTTTNGTTTTDVGTTTNPETPTMTTPTTPRLQPASLGSIINQFKSVCTKRIRAASHPDFEWQPRYHDRVIRNEDALISVRRYIFKNPKMEKDNALHEPDVPSNREMAYLG